MDNDLALFNLTLSNAVGTAAEDVLETMFFTVTSEAPVEADPTEVCGSGPLLRVRIRFQGTPSGTFAMDVAAASARTIAADFLGGMLTNSPRRRFARSYANSQI